MGKSIVSMVIFSLSRYFDITSGKSPFLMGTFTTKGHFKQLFRHNQRVCLMFHHVSLGWNRQALQDMKLQLDLDEVCKVLGALRSCDGFTQKELRELKRPGGRRGRPSRDIHGTPGIFSGHLTIGPFFFKDFGYSLGDSIYRYTMIYIYGYITGWDCAGA